MKKIIYALLVALFVIYALTMTPFLIIDDIIILFLIPLFVSFLLNGLIFLAIRIFKKINFSKLHSTFIISGLILQSLLLILLLQMSKTINYSKADIIADIDFSIKKVERIHPNCYSQIEKEDFKTQVELLTDDIKDSNTEAETFVIFSKIFSMLKDGHTGTSLNYLFNGGKFFFRKTLPYKLVYENQKVFVVENYYYRKRIPVGSELIEVNGQPVNQWISDIKNTAAYENDQFLKAHIELPFWWSFLNNFESFHIKYLAPNGNERLVQASGGLISKLVFLWDMGVVGNNYEFKIIDDKVGYMALNTFSTDIHKYNDFLENSFRDLKLNEVNNLIIDIRKNMGGSTTLADSLLQYICNHDFQMYDSIEIRLSKEVVKYGWADFDSTKQAIGDIEILNNQIDFISNKNHKKNQFTGNVYLLQGSLTYSSASDFASAFDCNNIGQIIGEETGGLTVCYGDNYTYYLPKTRMPLVTSTTKYYNVCSNDNLHGVEPDYKAESKVDDYINHNDAVLKFTLDLIKND